MRVLFLNPPVWDYMLRSYICNPTLGLVYLAGAVRAAGHWVRVLDAEAARLTAADVADYVRSEGITHVGITSITMNKNGIHRCIEAIRTLCPGVHVSVGGPHVTAVPEDGVKLGADLTVIGEAEANVTALFESRASGIAKGVSGYSMDGPGKWSALDSLPDPAWELQFPGPRTYPGNLPHYGKPEGIVMTQRGCPSKCTFCSDTVFFGRPLVYLSPGKACDYLERMHDTWGIVHFFDYSDEFVGGGTKQNEWIRAYCAEIVRRGLHKRITWKAQARCNEAVTTYEVLAAMREAGCVALMWGMESASKKVRTHYHKGHKEGDIWATMRRSKSAGIDNWPFLMVGSPVETNADAGETLEMVLAMHEEGLLDYGVDSCGMLTPLPGTEIYREAIRLGWAVDLPLDGDAQVWFMHEANWHTPHLTRAHIKGWVDRITGAAARLIPLRRRSANPDFGADYWWPFVNHADIGKPGARPGGPMPTPADLARAVEEIRAEGIVFRDRALAEVAEGVTREREKALAAAGGWDDRGETRSWEGE